MRPADPSHKTPHGLEYFPPVDTHLIRSQHVAQTFKIEVMQPAHKRGERMQFPVVYATDANRAFDMLKGISHIIQATGRDAPRFILVGIGYPGDSPRAGSVLRARDFTFPGFPPFTPKPPPVEGVLIGEEGSKVIHGAEDFQRFIRYELIPFIDDRYDTVPGHRTYFGHSGGGSFGLFTLFTQPDLFKHYLVSSPNLLFHGELDGVWHERCEFMFEHARRFIAESTSLSATKLYLSVGTEEEFEPGLEHSQMVSGFYRMTALLKTAAIPGLELITEALGGETHMTAWPIAFVHGLKAVMGPGNPSDPT